MQLHLGRGTLVELERDLLPVTIGNPQKPLYRRLLVELYGALTAPLVQTATNAIDPGRAEAARKELAAIGARGVKPLLDALSDEREAQQRIAVEVLAHVANPAAGPTLFNFATGQADRALRTRAMIAVGAIADRTIVPKLAGLLAPNDREAAVTPWDEVALAATWALARTGGKPAETVLESLAGTGSPEVRAMAIVGLGRVAGSAYAERLVAWVADAGSAPLVRAAAAQVVAAKLRAGELAPSPSLHAVVESRRAEPDPTVRNAVLAIGAELARLDAPRGELGARVRSALADAIVTGSPTDQEAALVAAASLVRSPTKGAPSGPSPASARLAPPSGKLDVRDVLRELAPPVPTAGAQLALLGTFESSLVEAIERALVRGPEVATRVAERLVAGEILPPFDRADGSVPERATGRAVTLRIRRALAPRFAELVDHPDARLRVHAARVVAASGSAATVSTIAAIATGEDEELALAMLGAVSESSDPEIALALADTSARARGWSVRARALATIERLGASGLADAVRERIAAKLASCAESDDFAVVREAALRALVATAGAAARDTLSHAKNADAEPHVRAVAASLLDTLGADR
jgi:HEAT repeat protein